MEDENERLLWGILTTSAEPASGRDAGAAEGRRLLPPPAWISPRSRKRGWRPSCANSCGGPGPGLDRRTGTPPGALHLESHGKRIPVRFRLQPGLWRFDTGSSPSPRPAGSACRTAITTSRMMRASSTTARSSPPTWTACSACSATGPKSRRRTPPRWCGSKRRSPKPRCRGSINAKYPTSCTT